MANEYPHSYDTESYLAAIRAHLTCNTDFRRRSNKIPMAYIQCILFTCSMMIANECNKIAIGK